MSRIQKHDGFASLSLIGTLQTCETHLIFAGVFFVAGSWVLICVCVWQDLPPCLYGMILPEILQYRFFLVFAEK